MAGGDSISYRDRLVDRLRVLVDSRGYSVTAVEKRLARGRGYVADALRGDKKLNVETILEVLAAVDVPPAEFFERPLPAALSAVRRRGRPPTRKRVVEEASSPPPPLEGSSPLLLAMMLFLAQRGFLRAQDLEQLQRELSAPEQPPSGDAKDPGRP